MNGVSWRGWIVTWLTKILFWRFAAQYKKRYGKDLPTILIAGTVGKTSQTLLLNNIFAEAGWNVFSGAKKAQSLNSITGLAMVVGGFSVRFEGARKRIAGIEFIVRTIFSILTLRTDFPENSIVIYECGIDSAGEACLFDMVFAPVKPILIVTSVTAEHTQGFNTPFNPAEIVRLGGRLPAEFLTLFTKKEATDAEKNVALEQVYIHTNPSALILPTSLQTINTSFVETLSRSSQVHNVLAARDKNFSLVVEGKFVTNPSYLMPFSFAKTVSTAALVAIHFNIAESTIIDVIRKTQWPSGRFSLFSGKNNTTLVDSTYNADPASVVGFLDLLEEVIVSYQDAYRQYQKTEEDKHLYRPNSHLIKNTQPVVPPKHLLVLGEMRELGADSPRYHKEVLVYLLSLARKYPDFIENVYLVGKSWLAADSDTTPKSENGMYFIQVEKQLFKVAESVRYLKPLIDETSLRPSSWVWLKGSQNTIFLESMVEHLLLNPEDTDLLCRRGDGWNKVRKPFVE